MINKFLKSKFKQLKLRTYIALGLLLVILPVVLLSLFKPSTSSATWMNDSWAYRIKVPVTAHTGAETDKYFSVTIDSSDTTRFQADCGDIRFTDANGDVLQYYIASGCSSGTTVIHVLVPTFPAGATDYYMYYGNPAAANGFSSADFTAGTAVTVGSHGSEEKGTGPVAYWNFDDSTGTNAQDSTSNNNDGTLSGATWQTEDKCVSGKCLYFDGTDDNVNVADNSKIEFDYNQDFTISMWIRLPAAQSNTVATTNRIVQKASGNYPYIFVLNNQTHGVYPNKIQVARWDGTAAPAIISTSTFNDNKWHYISFVKSSSTLYLYADGKQEGTTTDTTTTTTTNAATLYLGSGGSTNFPMQGYLDEVKEYNYGRSAAQIKADYNSNGNNDGVSASLGGTNQKSLSDGLVGYWKLDEASGQTKNCTAAPFIDSSGNANNGSSCPSTTGPDGGGTGKFGNAVAFDGTDDYISVPNADSLHPGDTFTLSAWVKRSGTGTFDAVFGTVTNDFQLAFVNDNIKVSKQSIGDVFVSTSTYTDTTSWHHIVAVKNGSSFTKVYYDGAEIAGTYTDRTITVGSSPIYIGGDSNAGDIFAGSIDEARIYNKALSGQEVRNLYNWAPGPVGYWRYDDKTGLSISDSSGNGNTATIGNVGAAGSWVKGQYGSAFYIGDSSVNTQILASELSLSTANTVSFWIRCGQTGDDIAIAGRDTTAGYMAYIDDCATGNLIYYRAIANGASVAHGGLTVGTWYHIEVVRDDTSVKFYMNGVQLGATQTLGGNTNTQVTSLVNYSTGAQTFSGLHTLDDMKIYNYARTSAQVVEDMNGGHPTGGSPVGSYVSYWKMDEANSTTAHDYNTTNGNSLTLSTSSWDLSGKTNTAWKGLGTNWLSRADDDDFDLAAADSGSISMWFKSTSATNPGATEYLFAKGRGTPPGYAVYFNTSGFLCFSIDDDVTWTPDDTACTTTDIYDGTWHHLVAEKNGTTELRLYVDGASRATDISIAATGTIASSGLLYVGDDDGDSTNSFAGDIDEVKFYRSALTQDQVLFDYNAGAALNFGSTASVESSQLTDGTGTAPINYWPMDEKTGTAVADKGTAAQNGTISGNTTWTKGKNGSALLFDGTAGVDAIGAFTPPAIMTYETWFNARGLGENSLGRIAVHTNFDIFLLASSVQFQANWSTAGKWTVPIPSFGVWHHLVVVYNSGSVANDPTIYIDGVSQTVTETQTPVGSITLSSATLRIGNTSGDDRTFDGAIDDFRIYNYARTAAQVAYDYNRGAPVGWWKLDECQGSTINDTSGKGNSGTLTVTAGGGNTNGIGTCNTSTSAWGSGTTGKFNASLFFDGNGDYVNVSDNGALNISGNYSASVWIKTSTSSQNTFAGIFAKTTDGTNSAYILQNTSGTFIINHAGAANFSTGITVASIADNVWHNIAYTYSGTTITVYLDGKQTLQGTYATPVAAGAGAMYIGAERTLTNWWNGQIDDLKIFNYALSATQVKQLYNNGSVYFGPSSGQP